MAFNGKPRELTPEEAAQVKQMIERGYRRISNKYGMVARIDRPDYLEHMAREMRKAPADFMVPDGRAATGGWEDHYRRVYSKDVVTLDHEVARHVPSSGWEATGYLP